MIETAKFIAYFARIWKILNVKNPFVGVRLNDQDRYPIRSDSDVRLEFLETVADEVGKMPGGQGSTRIKSLTTSTKNAFRQTLLGLVHMTKELLQHEDCHYVLLGSFQTDQFEGEFGIYRQLSGGNFDIGIEQILSSACFRKLQLYNKLSLLSDIPFVSLNACCTEPFSEEELDIILLFLTV